MYNGTIASIFKQQPIFIIILIFCVNIILHCEMLFLSTNSWKQVNELLGFFCLVWGIRYSPGKVVHVKGKSWVLMQGTGELIWDLTQCSPVNFRYMGRIWLPFKQSFLFSSAPATSHYNNLPEKEMLKHCQKGYTYMSLVPEQAGESENYVGVNLISDISWVILQTQEGWLVQIKARIRS